MGLFLSGCSVRVGEGPCSPLVNAGAKVAVDVGRMLSVSTEHHAALFPCDTEPPLPAPPPPRKRRRR